VYWVQNYTIKSIDSTLQGDLSINQIYKLIRNLEKKFNINLTLSPKSIYKGDLNSLSEFTDILLKLDEDNNKDNLNDNSFGSDQNYQPTILDTPRKYLEFNQLPKNHPNRQKQAIQALLETLKVLNIPKPDPVPQLLTEFDEDLFTIIIYKSFPLQEPSLKPNSSVKKFQNLLNLLQSSQILNQKVYHLTAYHLSRKNPLSWLYLTEVIIAIIRMVLLHPFERIRDFSLQSSPERQLSPSPPSTRQQNNLASANSPTFNRFGPGGSNRTKGEFKTPLSKLTRPGQTKRN
jgi:hypothetical protein